MKLAELAERLGGTLEGDGRIEITGVSGLTGARPDEVSFVFDDRYLAAVGATRAAALVVAKAFDHAALATAERAPPALIRVADPEAAVDRLVELFRPAQARPSGTVDPAAHVAASARLGAGVTVMPHAVVCDGAQVGDGTVLHSGAYVGPHARVGRQCVLHPNAVLRERCVLGDRVIVHPCAVIGSDGFGFRFTRQGHAKLEHIGTVEVGDDVEIGSCSTIDRARVGRTVVGRGTKIDNLVMVAHNCRIGEHVILVAQAGISGSTEIGDGTVIGGQAGIVGHLRIGRGVRIAAKAGVSKDVADGASLFGYVAGPHKDRMREEAAMRKLPALFDRVRELEKRLGARDGTHGEAEAGESDQ